MNDEQRSPRWLRARGPLLLACLGWACTVPTLVADGDIHELVSRCLDSPGAPAYVLPLSWAGLVLAVGAVCWGSWQLVTGVRSRTLRLSLGHALLCAALPVAAIGVPFQYALTQTAAYDTGTRPSPCFGHGPLVAAADPTAAGHPQGQGSTSAVG
ncbi:hypothetical protein [Streptomyces sp. NRRL WC-3742]|uniref:hypothetical protein n=1 Tax=Streptomyces sp. NRRL WC-3742 TaxID=1463934 RepID=UPI0004CA0C99|nr:hypothetical protein [Streptomyces sp. NRRL WC-3742]